LNIIQDISIIQLVLNASGVVQAIILLLAVVSFLSWYYIFSKYFRIKNTRIRSEKFENSFWTGGDLNGLYQVAQRSREYGLERIFESGFREFVKLQGQQKSEVDAKDTVDGARRAMRAAYQREMDGLEEHLSFLATTGSVSPYIGLLGTVWGIMHAFRALSNVGQATLAAVAPGIAEALVATAIGLFAAIPAVVAYNRYTHEIDRLASRFDSFIEEFSNILHRKSH